MSTNKPQIKSYVEPDIKAKFNYIAKKENRSESNQVEYLATKFIEDFEAKYGILIIEKDGSIHVQEKPKLKGASSNLKSG